MRRMHTYIHTLHYITLHYITLHYITDIHTLHTYIHAHSDVWFKSYGPVAASDEAWPCTYTPTTQKYNMERHSASNILQHPRFNCHRQTLASALAPTLLCCAAPQFADRLLYGQATGRHASSLDRAKRGKALNLCRATCKRACVVPTERRTSSAPTRIRLYASPSNS